MHNNIYQQKKKTQFDRSGSRNRSKGQKRSVDKRTTNIRFEASGSEDKTELSLGVRNGEGFKKGLKNHLRKANQRAFRLDPKNLRISNKVLREAQDEEERFSVRRRASKGRLDSEFLIENNNEAASQITEEKSSDLENDLIKRKRRIADDIIEIGTYTGNENELQDFLAEYFEKIPAEMKTSMLSDPTEINKLIENGQDSSIRIWKRLGCRLGKAGMRVEEILGVCIYQVDNTFFKNRTINILNISTLENEDLEDWINDNVAYIWSNDTHCANLNVELEHAQNPETKKLKLWEFIKVCFKSCGFRWKMLINHKNCKRSTVFGLKRDEEKYPLVVEK